MIDNSDLASAVDRITLHQKLTNQLLTRLLKEIEKLVAQGELQGSGT